MKNLIVLTALLALLACAPGKPKTVRLEVYSGGKLILEIERPGRILTHSQGWGTFTDAKTGQEIEFRGEYLLKEYEVNE